MTDLHPLIKDRRSPYSISDVEIGDETLASILEAARWAASSFNEQPWRFIVGVRGRGDTWDKLLSCLAEPNQLWAKQAPVLLLSVAKTTFTRNDKPNRHALHDVGAASAQLALQATALNLVVHQMAGFDAASAREAISIPAGFEPVAAIALGAAGDGSDLPEKLAAREAMPRTRNEAKELFFSGSWESPLASD